MNFVDKTMNAIDMDRDNAVFRVARRVFIDPEILKLEHERIFEKCWLYLGHSSEIATPGAFLRRKVAGRDLIFNRDAAGKVHAFYNLCPHRGGRVCREKSGNAKSFQCFYHGWVFASDGQLRNHPQEDLYPADFHGRQNYGLQPVPKLDQYRDFWFICLDPNAMSLSDYLGGVKPYLDRIADQSETGMVIVPGEQQFTVRANWKLWHENGMDPLHVPTVHSTVFDYTAETIEAAKKKGTFSADHQVNAGQSALENMRSRYVELQKTGRPKDFDLGNGHVAYGYTARHGRPFALWHPMWGEDVKKEIDEVYAKTVARVGEERAHLIAHQDVHILIFPNLAIVDNRGIMVRTYFSDTTDLMTVTSWTLAPKEEPPALRAIRLYNYMEFLGPAGFGTPDDIEAIENAQRGYRAAADYGGWNDASSGMAPRRPEASADFGDEGRMRVFWSRWSQYVGMVPNH
jgi:p-cumate 2,3-dioxygenase alpha subunit